MKRSLAEASVLVVAVALSSCCRLTALRLGDPIDRVGTEATVAIGATSRQCPIRLQPARRAAVFCPGDAVPISIYVGEGSKPLVPKPNQWLYLQIVEFGGELRLGPDFDHAELATDESGFADATARFGEDDIGLFRVKASFADGAATAYTYSRPFRITRACRGD